MGVKVTYTPSVFEVVEAHKYEDFADGWVMDADGVDDGTPDQFFLPEVEIDVDTVADNGLVTMIGGRLMGGDTIGLSGKVLLGWIKFKAVGIGTSPLGIDLAREHPNHPTNTFDNFVRLDGQVDEPTVVSFPEFCVKDDACEGDGNYDGFVNFADLALLRANFGTNCSSLPPGTPCLGDFNGDGYVNFGDLAVLRRDFGRDDCQSCGP